MLYHSTQWDCATLLRHVYCINSNTQVFLKLIKSPNVLVQRSMLWTHRRLNLSQSWMYNGQTVISQASPSCEELFELPVLMLLWNAVVCSCISCRKRKKKKLWCVIPSLYGLSEPRALLNMPLLNLDDTTSLWMIAVSAMYILRWLCHYKCFSLL